MKSKQLVVTSTIVALAALAVAATPCGWPKDPDIPPGGECRDPLLGGAYCTQPYLKKDGGCEGNDNTKTCVEGPTQTEYALWVLRAPNQGCNVSDPCMKSTTQVETVGWTFAVQLDRPCIKEVDPPIGTGN